MQPTDNIDVTLQAQTWEIALRMLAKGPYDVVAPIIADIQAQCMRQASPVPMDNGRVAEGALDAGHG